MAQSVKTLPAMQELQETRVQSLGREDPLEKGMATHSSGLAWRIPWTEEPGGLQSMGSQRVGHDWSNLACMHGIHIFHRADELISGYHNKIPQTDGLNIRNVFSYSSGG